MATDKGEREVQKASLTKTEIVLDVDYDTKMIYEDAADNEFEGIHFIPEGVWCREEDRSDSDHIAVCLPFSIFEELGSPAKLTATLEPGDKLNTLALAEETLEQIEAQLREDRAALPSLYGPGHVSEEAYYDAANPVAEAEQALSTLRGYLTERKNND